MIQKWQTNKQVIEWSPFL